MRRTASRKTAFNMFLRPEDDPEMYARISMEENFSQFLKRCVRFYMDAEKRIAELDERKKDPPIQ